LAVCRQHSEPIRPALPLNGIQSQVNDVADHQEKECPSCGQRLRFPKNVGGIVMACPSCKQKFHSDFKIGGGQRKHSPGVAVTLFELPGRVLVRIVRFFSS
jgi:predicted amidophosphoribosyltransferase